MNLPEKVEPLPEEFDPKEIVPPVALELDGVSEECADKKREIVLGRNVHTMCYTIKEPDADDDVTGEREAYMASVLARYRKSLIERTKHHLGMHFHPFKSDIVQASPVNKIYTSAFEDSMPITVSLDLIKV